jgi:hypothetical protein
MKTSEIKNQSPQMVDPVSLGKRKNALEYSVLARFETAEIDLTNSRNGIRIPAENSTGILNHGCTTCKDGTVLVCAVARLRRRNQAGTLWFSVKGPGVRRAFALGLPTRQPKQMFKRQFHFDIKQQSLPGHMRKSSLNQFERSIQSSHTRRIHAL